MQERGGLRDPRLTALVDYDRRHGTRLAESVLAWLDALGEVRVAADVLHIPPTPCATASVARNSSPESTWRSHSSA
nr:hypothetical protein [Streptomyces sp. TLI_235]